MKVEKIFPITILGATGYTGKLVAHELGRRQVPFAIAGRSREKLEALRDALEAEIVGLEVVGVDDAARLREVCGKSRVVINCVGPFLDLGEGVVRAAIEGKCHYLDTTGEQLFLKKIVEYHTAAEKGGVAVVNALAFEYALGDMGAAICAEGVNPISTIEVHYALTGMHTSRGTKRSAIRIFQNETFEFEEGRWVPVEPGKRQGTFPFPPPFGPVTGVNFPGGEIITLPRHTPARNVRVFMGAPEIKGKTFQIFSPTIFRMARSRIADVAKAFIDRGPEGPTPEERKGDHFQIGILVEGEAQGTPVTKRLVVEGSDPYGITAVITAEGGMRMSGPDFHARGVLPPAAAFPPRDFLEALRPSGITWRFLDES